MGLYKELTNKEEFEPKYTDNNLWYYLINKGQYLPNALGTTAGFYKNYVDMVYNTPNIDRKDKYFHAKANFNAGQKRDLKTAVILDVGKEIYDVPKKVIIDSKNGKRNTLKNHLKDSFNDLQADFYGYYQGVNHPYGKPQDYLKDIRPEELDDRY